MKQANAPEGAVTKKRRRGFFAAFIALFAIFFCCGFFTLGSFKSTGKSFSYVAGGSNVAVFDLNKASGQTSLTAVYINVGSIYVEPGTDITITVKRSSSSGVKPAISLGTATIGNFYSAKKSGKEGANFNWIPVAVDKSVSVTHISVSATANFELNEIVCIANDGKPIPISANAELSQGFTTQKKQLGYAVDAQGSFKNSSSAYYNFTQEEAYYMTSIHTVMGGGAVQSGSVYNVDGDFNSLATVLLLPSVAIFGDSPFALRFLPFLATCATLLFVFLLGGLLFKDEKYGFIFALIYALGGLASMVGRLGAPYALVSCFLVASLYFMYRFFSKGISGEHVVKGGLNVLFSGIFAALALAMNTLMIFPVAGILVLFGFGVRRMKKAYAYESDKLHGAKAAEAAKAAETKEASESVETTETAEVALPDAVPAPAPAAPAVGKELRKLKANYEYKKRVTWGFAALSFVLATFLLILFSSVVAYTAYVKAYDDPSNPSLSYASLLWKGLSAPFKISNVTEYTEANTVNVLAWLLPLKASTIYDGILEVGSSRYLAWNVSINAAASVVALIAFAFSTVSVIWELCTADRNSRANRRNRRVWLVLFGGMILSMLASAFVKNTSMLQSSLFGVFYLGFIPFAFGMSKTSETTADGEGKAKRGAALPDVALVACIVIFAVFFALSVPGMYGFEVPAKAAKYMFRWMSVVSNGYFRP